MRRPSVSAAEKEAELENISLIESQTKEHATKKYRFLFPRIFWMAIIIELFERAAYYSMASFVVIYLGNIGLGSYWPSTLNGVLWALVYFLPIISGTLADRFGFRKMFIIAFIVLPIGYILLGLPGWIHAASPNITQTHHNAFTQAAQAMAQPSMTDAVPAAVATPPLSAGASVFVFISVTVGIVLIGLGGSVVKPCVSGTVQKTAGTRKTLAFGIFYMVINVGSVIGRLTAYFVRTRGVLSMIFVVATGYTVITFFIVVFLYRDPQFASPAADIKRKSILRIFLDMLLVLRNVRFVLFLVFISGFWFTYSQMYNVQPLYIRKAIEAKAPIDLYTAMGPVCIVCFQLLITKVFGRLQCITSIIIGIIIISASMGVNIIPIYAFQSDIRQKLIGFIPAASLFFVLSVMCISFGEMFASARMYEYIGALAPAGQEGLFLGYANLPTAIGSLLGGPAGAAIFNEVICHGAKLNAQKLLDLVPGWNTAGWAILAAIGAASAVGMTIFNCIIKLYDRHVNKARGEPVESAHFEPDESETHASHPSPPLAVVELQDKGETAV